MSEKEQQRPVLLYDIAKKKRLRKAYHEAVKQKLNEFDFEGYTYVTGYAKYLLEYLDSELGND